MLRLLSGALFALTVFASPVLAQPTKIFLASTGNDANDGGRATPKRSLQAGHDSVTAGGEIVILDTAGYGALTITKSIGIVVPPGVNGFVTVTSSNGNGVTVNASATDVVTLRGLIVEGPGSTGTGAGIQGSSVGTLVVEDTTVRSFRDGISLFSSVSGRLVVRRGAVRDARNGIYVSDSASGAKLDALVTDIELTGNTIGTVASRSNGGSSVRLVVTRCAVSGSTRAFSTVNTNSETVVDNCTAAGNVSVFNSFSGGTNYTRSNNTMFNNAALGDTPTPLAAQ